MKYLQINYTMRITTFALLMSTNYFIHAMEHEEQPAAQTTSDHVDYELKEFDFKNHPLIGFKISLPNVQKDVQYELDAIMGNIVTSDTNVYFIGRFRFCFAPEKKDFLTSLGIKKENIPSYIYGFVETTKNKIAELINSSNKQITRVVFTEDQKKQAAHNILTGEKKAQNISPADYYETAGKLSCRLKYYSVNGIRNQRISKPTQTGKQIDGYFYDMTHDPLFKPDSENNIPSLLLGQPFEPRNYEQNNNIVTKFLLPMVSHSKLQLFKIANDEQKESSFQPLFEKPIRNHNSRPYIMRRIAYLKNDYILTSSGYANTLMTKISNENEKPFEFENAYLLDTTETDVFIASPSTSEFKHKLNLKLYKTFESDLCIYDENLNHMKTDQDLLEGISQKKRIFKKNAKKELDSDISKGENHRIPSYQFFEGMPMVATAIDKCLYMFNTNSNGDVKAENKELLLNQAKDLFTNLGEENDEDISEENDEDIINMKLLASRITYPYMLKNNNKLYLLDPSDESRKEQQEKTIDKNVLGFIHLKPDDQKKLFEDATNLKTAKEKSFAIHNAMHQFVALDEKNFLVDRYDKLYLLRLKSAEEVARDKQELLKKQQEHEIKQGKVQKMIKHEPQTTQKKIKQLKEYLKKKEDKLKSNQENKTLNNEEVTRLTNKIENLKKKIKENEKKLQTQVKKLKNLT